jgi:nicotinamide phosphoribosyltransferase
VFGGTINDQGYKVLDSHVGAIYGDSITLDRCEEICERLKKNGFASTNVVFGIGSFSMGYATRDNQGSAVKATYVEVNGVGREIFKDPITDDGTKKSAKGLIAVFDGKLKDQCTWDEVNSKENQLEVIYRNGELQRVTVLDEIRQRLINTNN